MSMNVPPISSNNIYVKEVPQVPQNNKMNFLADTQGDTFELTNNNPSERTTEEKQEIVKSARKKGAGWSALGGIITTAYYGLRSDNTVAKKFGLDPETDKDLIKQIKQDQTVWSLCGALGGIPGALIGYLVANSLDSKGIDIKD